MKKNFIYIISLFFISSLLFIQPSNAKDEITEGTEYWFGHPYTMKDVSEPVRWGIYPIELWVSSKVNTVAYIESADGTMQKTSYEIKANEIRVLPISDVLENRESEVVHRKGIHITSDDPISVGVFTAYKWSGEAYRVIPVEWLGKKYYTLNMYQDYVNMKSLYKEYKPAQILVIATEDGTDMTYHPSWDTEKGVRKGSSRTVEMNKGDTYLILGKIEPALNQDWETDLSGSYIEANKPIGVISGHTKGGFPRFSPSMYGIRADFVRNTLIEMMWPVELLGREYVSAPIIYEDREYGIVEDDHGDIIRFVATENNTQVKMMRQDGSTFKNIGPELDKGDWFHLLNHTTPGYYVANKPVLVGQYGKAWIANVPPPVAEMGDEKDDEMMNPKKNGQGMMLILAPQERWTTYATFRAPPKMNNYLYLTFKTEDRKKIKIDDQFIHITYGESQMIPILGSPFSYFASEISAGNHYVEGVDGATFAGYCYGNWDAYKDGFAYGYPIGINFADPCEDSLWVEEEEICGVVDGAVHAVDLQADTSCAGLYKILMRYSESENYTFTLDENFEIGNKDATFHLEPTDPNKSAIATLFFMTKSGKSMTKTYTYEPESIASDPTTLNFGLMKVGTDDCMTFKVINTGDGDLTIHDLRLTIEQPEYEMKLDDIEFPLILPPGGEQEIEVCATAIQERSQIIWDYIEAELDCYTTIIDTLRMQTGIPVVWIGDANFGEVPVGNLKSMNVDIVNRSDIDVEIYGISWDDKLHFPKVEDLSFPLTIKEGERHTFKAFYTPDVAGVRHDERAMFDCNTDTVKIYSDWTGIGIEAGPAIIGYDWQYKRVIDEYNMSQGIYEYEGTVTVSNTGNTDLDVEGFVIDGDDEGVFEVETDNLPDVLKPDEPIELKAYFRPDEQIDYEATATISTSFNQEILSASDFLLGAGIQPHINVIGKDFGQAILVGESKKDIGTIVHTAMPDEIHSMDLTITNIYIDNDAEGSFEIDPQFFQDNPYPITIKVGDLLEVPITYTGKSPGTHTAELVAESDAPSTDNHRGELIGRSFIQGLAATDHDYGTIFITTSGVGEVSFLNEGSRPVTIDRPISQSISGDINSFTINEVRDENGNQLDPNGEIIVPAGQRIYVNVTFLPMDVMDYSMQIEYKTAESGTAVSNLIGSGMILKTVVRIPKDKYQAKPGDKVTIEYFVDKHPDEAKPLAEADIRSIKAMVEFVPEDAKLDKYRNIYPDMGDDNVFDCNDIDTDGTMLEGWTCNYANITEDGVLMINYETEGDPLQGSGILFKFDMQTYLADVDYIPLPPTLSVQDEASGYVEIEEIPGDYRILPVCVDTLRLVVPSDVSYSLALPTPNPVINKTTIGYSIGIEANTKITLYNNNSKVVGLLVDQVHQPGEYEFELNVNELGLPSGVYHYTIESGPFKETKSFVISK